MKKIVMTTLAGIMAATTISAEDCIMVKDLNVQFKNDSTVYSNSYEMKEIREFAQFLKQTGLYAVIEGHTSAAAAANYNYNLSTRRASKVRAELVRLGVNPSKIKSMGFGESSPLYDNNTDAGSAKNRRVIGEVFNSSADLNSYINEEKARIAPIKYKEQ